MHSIPDGEKWFGYPAQPDRKMKRQLIALHQLPELLRRVAELEKKLGLEPEPPAESGPSGTEPG
jgi:UDP-3-O-[3-hydroxymyristoyl] glucosamine N-acyltransferase